MGKLTKTALQRKKPVTDELLIPADDAQAASLEAAQARVAASEQGLSLVHMAGESDEGAAQERLDKAKAHLEAVKDEIRKSGTSIILVGIGRVRWDELTREHPPTPEQEKENEEAADGVAKFTFDPKTFWPALLAETADSDLTPEDWRKMVFESKDWGPAELEELRERAKGVNLGSRIVALGN